MKNAGIWLTRDGAGKWPAAIKHNLWLGSPAWDQEKETWYSEGVPCKELCGVPNAIIVLAEIFIDVGDKIYIDDIQIFSPQLDPKKVHQS